ncbi:MAG: hypothetical protein JSW70_06025 [Syntrophobacterales bacterium]|nr:MAG: hypothetical protein JSW70_06025 [Syntrophobacterales bacterium]
MKLLTEHLQRVRTTVNHYKRQDVFKCVQQAHTRFENKVSVYHVLKERGCYPRGCIYFNWRCRKLNKGQSCPRKFKHVGRKCFGCKEFYDEKVINCPEVVLSDEEFSKFMRDLGEFETWVNSLKGIEVNLSGIIYSVKPRMRQVIHGKKGRIELNGFVLIFREAFIDLTKLEDLSYLTISKGLQAKYRFSKGDKIDLYARVSVDRGRLILKRPNRIEIDERGEGETWSWDKALVVARTASPIPNQLEKCFACDKGCLLDTIEINNLGERHKRQLFCLEGIKNPMFCVRWPTFAGSFPPNCNHSRLIS